MMKSIQKELADIQKTIHRFSTLLDQIEKTVDGMAVEKTGLKKGGKLKKTVRPKKQESQAAPSTVEAVADERIE
jgi:hypothetical protein